MPLSPGTRVGPYEISAQIGVGGMGEVYRAIDINLKREVAIKVIPDSLSSDPDRLARFHREAEVLAALNHPNIAHIHGLEKNDGAIAIVMELVEGPTLADRIQAGPIPVEEALAIARQIAESLEAAHERGIVHRDLKPANVKVREDGRVKVLDFGLAKAIEAPAAASPSLSLSPTITTPAMTQLGLILGTAAYMSPEQARGRAVDQRTDVWAFGCVLYEMLSGTRAFDAADVSLTLARVLEREIDLSALPAAVPPRVRRVIEMCLRKDVRQRLHAMGDVRLALDGVFDTPVPMTATEPLPTRPLWLRLAPFAALALIAAAAVGFGTLRPGPRPQVTRFQIHAPVGSTLPLSTPAIAPDGRRIAYTVTDAQGVTRIHVRPLDRIDTRVLPGTENAVHPFWFPDGRSVAFASIPDSYLKQVDVGAGSPRTLFYVPGPWHGTANQDGTLLVLGGGGISRWTNGEKPAVVARPDGEPAGAFPFFLPDGQRFLVLVNSDEGASIQLASLASPQRTVVVDTVNGAALMTRTPVGKSYLLFVRNSDLLAQEFDETAGVVRGLSKVIINDIGLVANPPRLPTVGAANGVLAYQTGGIADVPPLIWVSRSGAEVQRLSRGASVRNPQLSSDGERLLGGRFDSGASEIWVTDLRRGASAQITFSRSAYDALWSPDGTKIAYRRTDGAVVIVGIDGTGERRIAKAVNRLWDWSRDGRMMLMGAAGGYTIVPVNGSEKPIVIPPLNGRLREGSFSPDGLYIVFVSDESGRDEVYVQAMPPASFRTKISINGGILPRWRADGRELFFISPDSAMMSVDVNTARPFSAGIPRELFKAASGPNLVNGYAVRNDGQQFLMPGRDTQAETWPITVVLNWWAELE